MFKFTIFVNYQLIYICTFTARRAVEDMEEKKIVMPKKRGKELRILDGKTAQNLCK